MKISQINRIKLRKLWCNSERILSVVVSTILSALLIAGPAIATCITKAPSSRETGSAINDASQSNRIVQIVHLTVDLPYNNNHSSDEDYVSTMIALLHDGRVYTWGNNIYGGVGNGTACTTTNGAYLKQPPCHYSQPQEITKYFGEDKVVKLASNDNLAMAITKSGKVYRWGRVNSYGKVINHPTQYQKLSPHKITGYNEENAGPDMVSGGKYVYNEDTIFKVANSGDLDDLAPYQTVKPQLDGSTIRQVDHVWYLKNPGSTMDDSRGGFYVLTSKNKLLHVKKDYATTVEVTNPTIASRGGIKQIYRHYAIDNQGGLWHYGYGHLNTVNGTIVPSNHEPILDMSTKLPQPIPKFRDIIGSSLQDSSFSLIIRDINNRIYALTSDVNGHQKLTDVTDTLSSKEIKLFSGNISQPFFTPPSGSSTYYDYSFVTTDEDELDAVCSTVKNAYIYYRPISAISSNPLQDRKPRPSPTGGDANTATCVKIPSNNPDPVKPPTPANPTPTPGVPTTPKLPGVPNTGLRDDKVVQLVHSSTELDYYGEQKHGYKETWRDQDYAGTTVVLTESGKVYAWGNNIHGEVGNNTHCYSTLDKKPPCYYSDPQDITRYFEGNKIVKLANYDSILVAITDSGKMYHWGHDGTILHPVILKELSPYHIIGFGRGEGIFLNGPYKYLDKLSDNESGYLAFSKDTIFALDYDVYDSNRVDWLRYHDEEKNRIKPKLNGATILDVDHIKHRTPTADKPEPDKGGYYVLTSNHKLLKVLEDGTTNEITNAEIKKRGGFKQLSYTGHYAIDMQGGLWSYGHGDGNDPIHDMAKITAGGKLPHLDSFFSTIGPVTRGADGVIYAITDTHIDTSPSGYFLGRTVEPVKIGSFLSKQKIKLLSGEIETRHMEDTGYQAPDPTKDIPMYDYAFVPQDKPDTICVGLSGAAYNRIIGENRGPLFETIQPVDGTLPSTCVKLPPWNDGRPNPSPVPGAPSTPKAPGVPNTGSEPDPIIQLVHIPAVINGAINGRAENLTAKDTDYAGTVMVLTQSGRVFAWGNNYAGSVGVGTAGFKVPYPESVKSRREGHPEYYDTPQEITKYFGDDKVVRIGRYGRTSVAVTQSGKLYQWGWSYNPPWDWYDRLKNIAWTEPTLDPTSSLNKVTGIGGSYGDTYSGGGWLAHGDDTIFTKTSTSQLKDFGDKLKLSLNGATIRSVDYVDFNGRVAQNPQLGIDQSFKAGVYILTSTNKLLRVKNDGTTTEVTNDKIKSRGGIRQIANQYAIDNQGGLWYYGVSMSKDQIYDMSLKTLGGIIPLPQLRDIVGVDLIENDHMLNAWRRPWSSSVLVRGVNGHIYDVSPVETKFSTEDGGYPERRFALTDVTKLLGHDKIKLFDGKIHSAGATKPVDNEAPGLYDYSFVPESKLDTVCTVISGVASANASQAQSLYGHGHPMNVSVTTTKLVNDVFAPTCVKLPPLLTPDPKPSPTPNPKPTKPTSGIKVPFDRPKAPGAPNTGSEPLFMSVHRVPIFARR